MFKKKEKPIKEKKIRTMKVGTHKKSVIALWVVLIASVSFGVYKNFTAIDQHTTHEIETIQLRLNDTNGIENFVKNFAKSYYTWSNSKEAIEARTQAISAYLTQELQDLNVDTVRTDIPTSSTVTDVLIWDVEQSGENAFSVVYEVDQQIKEGDQTKDVSETYTVTVHVDAEHQIKTLTRKERTHRLCTRAAMLESYLPHPEAITDEQVSVFLKLLFHKDSTRQLMEKVFAGNGTEKEGAE